MEKLFILNPTTNIHAIKAGLGDRIDQLKAIVTVLMYVAEQINTDTGLETTSLYYTLFAVDGLLEEAWQLHEALEEKYPLQAQ